MCFLLTWLRAARASASNAYRLQTFALGESPLCVRYIMDTSWVSFYVPGSAISTRSRGARRAHHPAREPAKRPCREDARPRIAARRTSIHFNASSVNAVIFDCDSRFAVKTSCKAVSNV